MLKGCACTTHYMCGEFSWSRFTFSRSNAQWYHPVFSDGEGQKYWLLETPTVFFDGAPLLGSGGLTAARDVCATTVVTMEVNARNSLLPPVDGSQQTPGTD